MIIKPFRLFRKIDGTLDNYGWSARTGYIELAWWQSDDSENEEWKIIQSWIEGNQRTLREKGQPFEQHRS